MDQKRKNSMNSIVRLALTIGAVILLFLSSCPIKTGIKTLMGVPPKIEQVANNKGHFISTSLESCSSSILTDASTYEKAGLQGNNLLPAVILTALAFFFFQFRIKEDIPPLYKSIKIQDTLPIFLRDRKLII